MALQHQYSQFFEIEQLLDAAKERPFVWLQSPAIVHKRSNSKALCTCGCGSRRCTVDRVEESVNIIFDRVTGVRKALEDMADPEAWYRFANSDQVLKINAPVRCYEKQYQILTDTEHKQIGVFGGNRSGKTSIGLAWFAWHVYMLGGRAAKFLIVAETKEKCWVSVRKLIHGERIGRTFVPPLIPPQLVVSAPANWRAQELVIRLVDGSEIWLKHGDAGAIKGDSYIAIFVDEICEIVDHNVWAVILGRLVDSGGQVLTASTPKAGHWSQRDIHEVGKSYEEAANDPDYNCISIALAMLDNVWLSEKEILRSIPKGKEKDPKIRRDFFGEWVGDGQLLWRNFKPEVHLRSGHWTDVRGWGLANITPAVARSFFRKTQADLLYVGGQDFNVEPTSVIVCQVACPPGCDQGDPENWIIFALFEISEDLTIHPFAKHLRDDAGKDFNLRPNFFQGLAISCDATGAYTNPPTAASHGMSKLGATFVKAMASHGFDCRPCHKEANANGKITPRNPMIRDRVNLMHMLMSERCPVDGFRTWPRFVVHAERCPKLVSALELQEADEFGKPDKRRKGTNTPTPGDKLSSTTDAVSYLCWSLLGKTMFHSKTTLSADIRPNADGDRLRPAKLAAIGPGGQTVYRSRG